MIKLSLASEYFGLRFHNMLGSLRMQRFWATDGNRKCAVFLFNLSSLYPIYIVNFLLTSRDY